MNLDDHDYTQMRMRIATLVSIKMTACTTHMSTFYRNDHGDMHAEDEAM